MNCLVGVLALPSGASAASHRSTARCALSQNSGALPNNSRLDYPSFVPRLWHWGRIAERRGDIPEGHRLYRQVLQPNDRPDANVRAVADLARSGLGRVGVA